MQNMPQSMHGQAALVVPNCFIKKNKNHQIEPDAVTRLKKILVPVDFSGAAQVAFHRALALAARDESEIVALNVVTLSESVDPEATVKTAQRNLEEFCKNGFATNCCQPMVRTGIPFVEITQTAEQAGADLIVLGRNDSTAPALSDGHTAERVLRYAKCPVLVVRE